MGLAKWAAEKIGSLGKGEEMPRLKAKILRPDTPYRRLRFLLPAGATRSDVVRVFAGLVEDGDLSTAEVNGKLETKGGRLKIPVDAEREDLMGCLAELVDEDAVSADVVYDRICKLRAGILEKVRMAAEIEKVFPPEEQKMFLAKLAGRFEASRQYHEGVKWAHLERALKANPKKLLSLWKMEETGGEPDLIFEDEKDFVFGDCSPESPAGRRDVVFDRQSQEYLAKRHPEEKCAGNAVDLAAGYGAELMDERCYREAQPLQSLLKVMSGEDGYLRSLDVQTESWINKRFQSFAGYNHIKNTVPIVSFTLDERTDRPWYHSKNKGFRCMLRVPKE